MVLGTRKQSDKQYHDVWYDQNYAADTWAFTVKFYCLAGQNLLVGLTSSQCLLSGRLKVTVGTAQTKASQTTTLWNNNNLTNTTWTPDFQQFCAYSGFYYFAFNCYSVLTNFV